MFKELLNSIKEGTFDLFRYAPIFGNNYGESEEDNIPWYIKDRQNLSNDWKKALGYADEIVKNIKK
jgi:hypothetical protein